MSGITSKGKKRARRKPKQGLRVIRSQVAGIDLGSREHYVSCPPTPEGEANVRHFGTTTPELLKLADWLKEEQVESVAMESTGVYWIPIYEILESRGFEVLLVNARALSCVPGRKTDMLDSQWIQMLHSCGLLKGSFRPGDDICALRSLVREKTTLDSRRADWLRRIQKSLDQMNVCVHHAVSDISGVTGMKIIRAIVDGERAPKTLAKFRDKRCRKSVAQIAEELTGNWRPEHLFSLKQALRMYDHACVGIAEYEDEIQRVLAKLQPPENKSIDVPEVKSKTKRHNFRARGQEPIREALFRLSGCDLTAIDGIGVSTAEAILSELGTDLSCFPSEKHFVSFLKLAPKLSISGGKPVPSKRGGSTTTRLGATFRMAGLTLRNSKTALGSEYRRISRRKGASVAVFAMARKLAILVYRLLRHGQAYLDEGMQAYEERFKAARLRTCKQIAKEFGYTLLEPEGQLA
ncbi:MAG: IS110 family transposase [Lentisphaeria bacterium]|nr:IS110 family transposase [Lentisphaeria bacterium]